MLVYCGRVTWFVVSILELARPLLPALGAKERRRLRLPWIVYHLNLIALPIMIDRILWLLKGVCLTCDSHRLLGVTLFVFENALNMMNVLRCITATTNLVYDSVTKVHLLIVIIFILVIWRWIVNFFFVINLVDLSHYWLVVAQVRVDVWGLLVPLQDESPILIRVNALDRGSNLLVLALADLPQRHDVKFLFQFHLVAQRQSHLVKHCKIKRVLTLSLRMKNLATCSVVSRLLSSLTVWSVFCISMSILLFISESFSKSLKKKRKSKISRPTNLDWKCSLRGSWLHPAVNWHLLLKAFIMLTHLVPFRL